MKRKFVYIENDSLDVYFNFALEYYLATEKTFEDSTVLLFWRTSPALLIGKYQNIGTEINEEYARRKEISLVRRMSGGRTVFTDLGGWQFSFITKKNGKYIPFEEYIQPVIDVLEKMGIHAEFSGRNDLVIKNRIFSGLAQYAHNGFLVQHGLMHYGTNLEDMAKGIRTVHGDITNISDHLREPIGTLEFKRRMVEGLLGENGSTYTLTEKDIERIRQIAREKFQSRDSIWGKNLA